MGLVSTLAIILRLAHGAVCEIVVPLPASGGRGSVAFAPAGQTAFRARLLLDSKRKDQGPIDTPMIDPDLADVPFQVVTDQLGTGISTAAGSLVVSRTGELVLRNPKNNIIAESRPLKNGDSHISFKSSLTAQLYGRGASPDDYFELTSRSVKPYVSNRVTYVPHYYSTDGYAALGVVNASDYFRLPANYSLDVNCLTWSFKGTFDLYLMPAATLVEGTAAYYSLIGAPAVPPRYAFGFIASRWGWSDRAYIEDTLTHFRSGQFPLDAIAFDFEWYTNDSDYFFTPEGKIDYPDFSFGNKVTFPQPRKQLSDYLNNFHVRMSGLRKPRLGNRELLEQAHSRGWILPNGHPGGTYPPDVSASYAVGRGLDYSQEQVRTWYSQELAPLLDDGVEFWWNDEGETDFFTYHWWNVAELDALRSRSKDKRFYTLNRAVTPGMTRLGATAWTGDVTPTWHDLSMQPGIMLNWGLAGAPYVGCDIGGFLGRTTAELLTRWMQVGAFMPTMRVHSTNYDVPHFPWLWGDAAARVLRETLGLRYKLIPYHYSLAHAMYSKRALWIRPLMMEFPEDPNVANITSQWMDGEILVAPILQNSSERTIYLPSGTWYPLGVSEATMIPARAFAHSVIRGPARIGGVAELDEVPAFVRAGTVLPVAPLVQYTDALPGGPLEIQVYAGMNGSFELVEDDGETVHYQTGHIRTIHFTWDDAAKTLSWTLQGEASAPGSHAFKEVFVTLFTPESGREPHRSATRDLGIQGSIQVQMADIEDDMILAEANLPRSISALLGQLFLALSISALIIARMFGMLGRSDERDEGYAPLLNGA